MNKLHLYVLAAAAAALGLGIFLYKVLVLGFPLWPVTSVEVWNVQARIGFVADGNPVKASVFIPSSTTKYAIVDEHFVSGTFGFVVSREDTNRRATWSVRRANGKQSLYYQAVVRRVQTAAPVPGTEVPKVTSRLIEGPNLQATKALLAQIREKSADTNTMVSELIKHLNSKAPDENVRLLLGPKPTQERKVRRAVRVLEFAGIPARMVNGVNLHDVKAETSRKTNLIHWLEVYENHRWQSFDMNTGSSSVPDDWLPWFRGIKKLASLEGGSNLKVTLSVSPKVEEGIAAAVRRGEISRPVLLRFSLFSLPVNIQAVYKVILLVPLGAVLLVIMRNIVGIKTFGTFMPVLIALSFRETGLLRGILLFSLVVALGLSARFYLERLKLLVVPRLAAVLIVVVGLMAALSILSYSMGGHLGLSVALFPMVILTMTIERMSIVWEERGSIEALTSGLGSLLTAAIAFVVMNIKFVEHLIFVFPELLLVLFAITLLLGRYTGYRLLDLYRFRDLARG